jgi:hypothetical protein
MKTKINFQVKDSEAKLLKDTFSYGEVAGRLRFAIKEEWSDLIQEAKALIKATSKKKVRR